MDDLSDKLFMPEPEELMQDIAFHELTAEEKAAMMGMANQQSALRKRVQLERRLEEAVMGVIGMKQPDAEAALIPQVREILLDTFSDLVDEDSINIRRDDQLGAMLQIVRWRLTWTIRSTPRKTESWGVIIEL